MTRTTTPTSSSYNIVISIITTVDDLTKRSVSMLWTGHSDRGTQVFLLAHCVSQALSTYQHRLPFRLRNTDHTQYTTSTMAIDFVDHKHHLRNSESSSSGSSIDCMDAPSFSFSDHQSSNSKGRPPKVTTMHRFYYECKEYPSCRFKLQSTHKKLASPATQDISSLFILIIDIKFGC